MADPNGKKFRASYGLDAGDEKLINVAMADRTNKTDGVSVGFLIQENTVQKYDPTRTYYAGFAVINNERIWVSNRDVPVPVDGKFDVAYWDPLRTDPRWVLIADGVKNLRPGDYISTDTSQGKTIELVLPTNMVNGDTIVIRDIGGRPGYNETIIKSNSTNIRMRGVDSAQIRLTIPYSELLFVYNNNTWNVFNTAQTGATQYINTDVLHEAQSGQMLVRQYKSAVPIQVKFPKNANHGDIIQFVGMDQFTTPYYNLSISTFDASTSIGVPGQKTMEVRRILSGYFVFDNTAPLMSATWRYYDTDQTDRARIVSTDTRLVPNETVSVQGTSNSVASTINLTLPTDVENGDQITIAMNMIRSLQTVVIKASGTDKIRANEAWLQFPKRSAYPLAAANWVESAQLSFGGTAANAPTLTLAYVTNQTANYWVVINNIQTVERVDDTQRARVGVIALADQATVNKMPASIVAADKVLAVTPETLANRTALETRTGITQIATTAQVQVATTGVHDDFSYVTPKKLNDRSATETRRGLAEIATAAEITAGTDDTTIVTPLKLVGRIATEGQTGIAALVKVGGVAPVPGGTVTRDTAGTNIYDHSDHSHIVTPKVLREYKANEVTLGAVYLATGAEVIGGVADTDGYPTVVTPYQLHQKTAQEGRIGFTQIATQAETNAGTDDFKYITPKKLNTRVSTEALTGIARQATQTEFNAGTSGLIAGPDKIKAYLSTPTRTAVVAADGLTQSGNLWTTTTFGIVAPTTTQRGTTSLATSAEVNAGTDNTKIVTPLTLQGKKASTGAEGIIQLATQAEVIAGTVTNKAVVPADLKHVIQTNTTWEATPTIRGTVKTSTGATTWQGDDVQGNAAINLETQFAKNGMAVSPYEFNLTLRHYLPIGAKAVDADKLDGIDSSQFIRKDIAQTIAGAMTFSTTAAFNSNVTVAGDVISQANIKSKTGFYIAKGTIDDNNGVYLYGSEQVISGTPTYGRPMYGIYMGRIADDRNGAYGAATSNYAIYNTIAVSSATETRGWIWQRIYNSENTNVASISAQGIATFASDVNTIAGSYRLNGVAALASTGSQIRVGSGSVPLALLTTDASDIKAIDTASTYTVMTTKNRAAILDPLYVKKSGDTMTGSLEVANAPAKLWMNAPNATGLNQAPVAGNAGTWSAEVSVQATYQALPGYVVPVKDKSPTTGADIVVDYTQVPGPGTLSQFGVNPAFTYQIWAPRPAAGDVNKPDYAAATFWMRQWNSSANAWGGWGRIYTSNNPPTANEVGAVSDNGSTFSSLKIRDWLQIGNVRVEPDPTTRSVQFTWIDNP